MTYNHKVHIKSSIPEMCKAKGADIFYGIHATEFGKCFIAICKLGICGLEFFDENKNSILSNFQNKWPKANLQEDLPKTKKVIESIFSPRKKVFKVLLFGTEFQIKVWQALVNIPFGQLASYCDIAKQIGKPKAYRAVASAIAKNNIAYLVPCHRVVKSNGGLGGYKWGKKRKSAIIGWEKAY